MYDKNPPPPRQPSPSSDFTVDVDGLGPFIFGRRKMADQFAIEVEFARLTQGVHPTDWLKSVGEWMSTLRVLMVKAPNGFNLDELDPLDDEVFLLLARVFNALRQKEETFRQKPKAPDQGDGKPAGADGGLLVSPQVQPVAEGPAVP